MTTATVCVSFLFTKKKKKKRLKERADLTSKQKDRVLDFEINEKIN